MLVSYEKHSWHNVGFFVFDHLTVQYASYYMIV